MTAKMIPVYSKYTEVVRVATNNNFNCTEAEYEQLTGLAKAYPQRFFFVNSNVKTPLLENLNNYPFKSTITVNPDLASIDALNNSIDDIIPERIAFLRVKWLPEDPDIESLTKSLLDDGHAVVVTMQRWNSKKSLSKFTDPKHYKWSCSRFRLAGDALRYLEDKVDDWAASGLRAYMCDRSGQGCSACRLCVTLPLGECGLPASGEGVKLSSLNMSSSGMCPYYCPDCYAHRMQEFLESCENEPIMFDTIKPNCKQKGSTKHAKAAKEGH